MQLESAPTVWEPGLLDSKLESDLTRSIENARRAESLPQEVPSAQTGPVPVGGTGTDRQQRPNPTPSAKETVASSTLAQQVGGCGIAVIDGYLTMKDYAAQRGLDLVELHHKGIDLQDLISTLIIGLQYESRDTGARRYKR